MKTKGFIINKLRKLVKTFPSVKVSYSFHELSETHFVEILPKDFYYNNELFKQHEEDLIIDFITKCPIESLCFLTEDSIVPIENVELAFIGDDYEDCNSTYNTILEYEGELFENKYYEVFENIFRDFIPEFNASFILEQEIKATNSLPSFLLQNGSDDNKEIHQVLEHESGNVNLSIDMDYSLAA